MFKLTFLVHSAVFNDTSIVFHGKRLRVYTIVDFSFIRTFAPSF